MSGYGGVKTKVRKQVKKAARTAACTIWSNKHIGIEVENRIYKTAIGTILTVIAENRPETS